MKIVIYITKSTYKDFYNDEYIFKFEEKQKPINIKLKRVNKIYYGENWREKKGRHYEYYIGEYFKQDGYRVFYHGISKGYEDKGIDLIAWKEKQVILIQCKNWKNGAELPNITKFYNDCMDYEKYNKRKIGNREIRRMFIISNEIENKKINEFLERINYKVEFFNMPFFE